MNEFVSWCRHLLVSFLFHALTSLHPPSFHRNDFSTCIYVATYLYQSAQGGPARLSERTPDFWYKIGLRFSLESTIIR